MAEPLQAAAPAIPWARRISFWGFAALLLLGVSFYMWWGLAYGAWLDNGVYAVTIVLVLFGLSGMWLVMPGPSPAAAAPAKP